MRNIAGLFAAILFITIIPLNVFAQDNSAEQSLADPEERSNQIDPSLAESARQVANSYEQLAAQVYEMGRRSAEMMMGMEMLNRGLAGRTSADWPGKINRIDNENVCLLQVLIIDKDAWREPSSCENVYVDELRQLLAPLVAPMSMEQCKNFETRQYGLAAFIKIDSNGKARSVALLLHVSTNPAYCEHYQAEAFVESDENLDRAVMRAYTRLLQNYALGIAKE